MRDEFRLETSCEMKAKKIPHLRKAGNEGISKLATKQMSRLASSFSLTEKRPFPQLRDRTDERNQTGILTLGLNLAPAFPLSEQWHWGFVTRYSGATVPESHRVPWPSDCRFR